MRMQKYEDMAYGNPRGREWLRVIHSKNIWDKWILKVQEKTRANWHPDSDRPAKILTAAIWHFGFAHDSLRSSALRRTARRLRSDPPDRGAGVLKGDLSYSSPEMHAYGMPEEFYMLDNFLEHEVRPMLKLSPKDTSS